MKKHDKNISLIKSIYNEEVIVSQPMFIGEHHKIYVAETKHDKTIFRLSNKDCAFKNFNVTRLLRKYEIPVPEINLCRICGKYFEMYSFIEGKTLYQRHQEGISPQKIENIYKQLCDICYRMSLIPVEEAENIDLHICRSDVFFKLLNNSPRVIGHCDLNDKNILLDENDDVCAILDLDDIALKTMELFLIQLFTTAQEKGYGYNVDSIKHFVPSKYHADTWLNLSKQYEIYTKLLKIKDKISHNKQLLKIKTK